ncbi:DUF1360 domain-containing protein [Pseudalkalibacillus caeni]|uniref:DUF1360 domain-containing protein n=1 Tax=Exobacillus caeni TaxID=2574798 RepID=A0A5R9F762_9BACL|nr:DUF1360 domain-containing protein [Pseudalkalibacillus caeni]TLS37468.1 DUF1360 domain-containing protein [Pseudalkalibacillus caeni]
MFDINWLDLIIIILASYRLTHLIVFDEITSFIRSPFVSISYNEDASGQMIQNIEIKGSGLRYWIGLLLSCYWCVGIWSSTALVLLYLFCPLTFPILLILAVAGAAAFIESKTTF